jgi:hypothetical protein
MRRLILTAASLLGLAVCTTASAEKPRANLGVLTCTFVKPTQDPAQKMSCGFKPAGTGAEEKYSGTVRETGQELPPGKVVLIWQVLGAAEEKVRAGVLSQRFVKSATAPGQPPMLVGETDPTIALQFETNDGAATYNTIIRMELALTGTPA